MRFYTKFSILTPELITFPANGNLPSLVLFFLFYVTCTACLSGHVNIVPLLIGAPCVCWWQSPYLPVNLARGRVFFLLPLPLGHALKERRLVVIGRAVALALDEQRVRGRRDVGAARCSSRAQPDGSTSRCMTRGIENQENWRAPSKHHDQLQWGTRLKAPPVTTPCTRSYLYSWSYPSLHTVKMIPQY